MAKPFIESPVWSGLVLDMCRSKSISHNDMEEIKAELWMKEINTMNGTRRPSTLNYNAIFYQEHEHEALLPNTLPCPTMNAYIRSVLVEWRDWMKNTVHYPRMTSKRSARNTERLMDQDVNWRDYFPDEPGIAFCQRVMERHYAETGVAVGGMCEIRQKWYRSGVVPRTYVAQGGSAYHSSKWMQAGFNHLVNLLPSSNYILRLLPTNLDVSDGRYAFIYDLSTFTSNFHEHDAFMRALANFCSGYTATIWDGRDGYKTVSLYDALIEYANINTNKPSYSWERWNGDLSEHHQEVAGFLGVFGNLMTCTFLHSAVILTVVACVRRLYTAGDDGGVALYHRMKMEWNEHSNILRLDNDYYDDVNLVFTALEELGIIAWQKVFTTQEDGAIALKRPLVQWHSQLFTSLMLIWPSMSLVELFQNWKRPDPRFSDYVLQHTRAQCRSSCISELTRFQSSIRVFSSQIPVEDLEWIFSYLQGLYRILGCDYEGSVPQLGSRIDSDFVPVLLEVEDLHSCPFERTIYRHYRGSCRVPCREADDAIQLDPIDIYVGSVFTTTSSPLLGWLENTGYVSSSPIDIPMYGHDGLIRLLSEYTTKLSPRVYTYTVNNLPPCLL